MKTAAVTTIVSPQTAIHLTKVGIESALAGIACGILYGSVRLPIESAIPVGMALGLVAGGWAGVRHATHETGLTETEKKATEAALALSFFVGMLTTTGTLVSTQLLMQKL